VARLRLALLVPVLAVALLPSLGPVPAAVGAAERRPANPIATDEQSYQAFGRVFSDPHGCLVHDGVPSPGAAVSPWAKGNACATDYLSYPEVVEGARFLARRFPDLIEVIRLDEAYDNPEYRSAGIGRVLANEGGDMRAFGRDRSPLYLFKVTDRRSEVPEADRHHFAYSLAIHGLERAGLEGGIRALEDLVTWAACERGDDRAARTPACAVDGPFPKPIVESESDRSSPTAAEVLRDSVIYFFNPNPDGWRLGEKQPVELRDGALNTNYHPGPSFGRQGGNGVDLNRDFPAVGYTLKSHQPLSEPESRAFAEVLTGIRAETTAGRFAGGIDLHGMLNASAFSYTLLRISQDDYRKNAITVETALRTYEDQTQRLRWSPYIGDSDGDGVADRPAAIPVADQWGTIFDTLGYSNTGTLSNWIDSPIGLGGVGISNEMALSHLAPNTIYEPALVQTHIDGNKGLIYSQLSAMLLEEPVTYEPTGRIGYVFNPVRITDPGFSRPSNPGLPSQRDIDVVLPCRNDLAPHLPASCGEGTFSVSGTTLLYEFDVLGHDDGIHNGGLSVQSTSVAQMVGSQVSVHAGATIQRLDEATGQWRTVKGLQRTRSTVNDPEPGRYRLQVAASGTEPRRVEVLFDPVTAEAHPGQLPIDASSMDFFSELNAYVPEDKRLQAVDVAAVVADPEALDRFDTLVVTNNLGVRDHLTSQLGVDPADADAYFAALEGFAARGGNLVLLDAALNVLHEVGVVERGDVRGLSGLAGFYGFRTAADTLTYTDPETYPLAAGVDLPGAAEQTLGNRQAVEPTPMGYSPENHVAARMPFWGVARPAWEARCAKPQPTHCTVAATSAQGAIANLGEIAHGDGLIRIGGAMLPDPLRQDDATSDNRFGLSSYALTYTAYIVFENLVDHQRPG
jgi:hypothetical protein